MSLLIFGIYTPSYGVWFSFKCLLVLSEARIFDRTMCGWRQVTVVSCKLYFSGYIGLQIDADCAYCSAEFCVANQI